MAYILYTFAQIFLCIVYLMIPGGICLVLYDYIAGPASAPVAVVGIVISAVGFLLRGTAKNLRIRYRQDVEYDEFGRSKKKTYDRMSRKERELIDFQKTADMERILPSTEMKKITKKGSADPDADMNALIGLEPVKQKMREMVARMEFETGGAEQARKKRKKAEKKNRSGESGGNSMSGRHMVFYGNPGTGKTTCARIITGFLYRYGYIAENKVVEVDGNFLKAGGESTDTKTKLVVRQAFGGVLFVDEAYALMYSSDGSGEAAIATLIKEMEDNRDRFILILAGYTDEMHMLLETNPGFSSRVKEYLEFPDYSDQEMREIFEKMAEKEGFTVSSDVWPVYDERIAKERRTSSFGNARTARNVLSETLDRHSLNYVDGKIPNDMRNVICREDVSAKLKKK